MKNEADVVIIGGGITGLGLAYHLIQRGVKDLVVLEKGYLGVGASGRFPGGVIQQYPTTEEVSLAREGVGILQNLSADLKFNIMFRQQGSIMLARSEERVEDLRTRVEAQNKLTPGLRMVNHTDAQRIIPMLDDHELLFASYCPSGGVIYPYALLWGYARRVEGEGGEVRTYTEAKGIKVDGGQVRSVITSSGGIRTSKVVNAGNISSLHTSGVEGVDIPINLRRYDFLVTEPLKHFLNPFVFCLDNELQMAQSARGEVVCGIPGKSSGVDMRASIESLARITRAVIQIIPQFRNLKVMRQWVAYSQESPDGMPIVGEVDNVDGLIQANAFGSHGLEFSTAIVRLLADQMVEGRSSKILERFSPARFRES